MKKTLVAHPFFFVLFPLLVLFLHNLTKTTYSQLVLPSAVLLVLTSLLLLAGRFLVGDYRKSGLLVSFFWLMFFSYGHVDIVLRGRIPVGRMLVSLGLLVVCGAALVVLLILLRRTKRSHAVTTKILNIVAVAAIVVPTFQIVTAELSARRDSAAVVKWRSVDPGSVVSVTPDTLRDVYYLVADRYGSSRALKEIYGFDNSEFLDALRDRGFYVAESSLANYAATHLSLPTSFNMDYMNDVVDKVSKPSYKKALRVRTEDYFVWRFLESKGYQFIHFGSWWDTAARNRFADRNISRFEFDEFSRLLYSNTLMYPVAAALGFSLRTEHHARVLFKFRRIAEIAGTAGPKYVFAHFLLPHQPFSFNRDGSYPPRSQLNSQTKDESYINQLVYANRLILELVDVLQAVRPEPIIVIQADEGPHQASDFEGFSDEVNLRAQFGILNAYRFPAVEHTNLYQSITPVNSFRVLFNEYFGTTFELVPDRCYELDHEDYRFVDVTDRVRSD